MTIPALLMSARSQKPKAPKSIGQEPEIGTKGQRLHSGGSGL